MGTSGDGDGMWARSKGRMSATLLLLVVAFIDDSGALWGQEQQAYIKAVNAGQGDYFGRAVSLAADTLAVGAYSEGSSQTSITNSATASSDDSASYAGAVYVYLRTGGNWAQQAYIKAVNADSQDFF